MKTELSTSDEKINITLSIDVRDLIQAQASNQEKLRGRPKSLSIEDERLFQLLIDVGANVEDICSALSIGRASYFRYKKRLLNNK